MKFGEQRRDVGENELGLKVVLTDVGRAIRRESRTVYVSAEYCEHTDWIRPC